MGPPDADPFKSLRPNLLLVTIFSELLFPFMLVHFLLLAFAAARHRINLPSVTK